MLVFGLVLVVFSSFLVHQLVSLAMYNYVCIALKHHASSICCVCRDMGGCWCVI